MDLDAYVAAHVAEWRGSRSWPAAGGCRGREPTSWSSATSRSRPTSPSSAPPRPTPRWSPTSRRCSSRARNRAAGTRTSTWRGVRRFFVDRFPAALYRLRWWWLGTLAANVVVTGVMIAVAARATPTSSRACSRPAEVDQLVNARLRGLLQRVRRQPLRRPGLGQQRLGGRALPRPRRARAARSIWLLFQNIANLAIIGSIMIRHDHGAHFWGLLLPHGLLELTAVFVAGGVGLQAVLVVGRAGRADPHPVPGARGPYGGHGRARPGRGAARQRGHRGVRDAVAGCPTWARVGIGILAEAVFFAYVFVLGRDAFHRGQTGDLDAALLEDRVATQAEVALPSNTESARISRRAIVYLDAPRAARGPSAPGSGRRAPAAAARRRRRRRRPRARGAARRCAGGGR